MSTTFEHFVSMDARLVEAGFPPTSDWWLSTLRAFYASSCRQLVLRVGRRGGKSSTLCRVGVVEALAGGHVIPPGDVGVVVFISTRREEAAERLRTIAAILDALDVAYRKVDQTIELVESPIIFRVFVATVAGVSGPTAICVLADECAKWRDTDTGSNPAREVLASVRPTIATQPRARIFLSSSPWSTLDAHAEAFARGDDSFQQVAHAETWVANPSITEAETHALESDVATHSREYGAIPMVDAASAFFDADAIDAAIDPRRPLALPGRPGDRAIMVGAGVDFAFTSDSSAIVVVHQIDDAYDLAEVDELRPLPGAPLKPSNVCARFAEVLKRHGARDVLSDAWQRESVREYLEAAGIEVSAAPAGQGGKVETYTNARVVLHQGMLRLPKHDRLRGQLREVVSRPTSTGLTISSPRRKSGHGDVVSALVLALWAARDASPRITVQSMQEFARVMGLS